MIPAFFLLLALAPDRPALPDEWGYRPADATTVRTNPPSLSWVHEKEAAQYEVQWASEPGFGSPVTAKGLRWSVYTHSAPLSPGAWYWRYRGIDAEGKATTWSRTRSFTVPAAAPVFPQPTLAELKRRVPGKHPRLFLRPEDLPRLREWAAAGGREPFRRMLREADAVLRAGEPTPEPAVKANASDPATNQFWWSNRVQTIKALQEAEVLSFAWLMTSDRKYGDAARNYLLRLAAWDPDGPTNFKINCEAAKPMLHRLARAYDWAYDLLNNKEREQVRGVLLRRAQDAWKSGEVREGAGHLNQPYSSHGNRTWHKLAENAIATLGETPESDLFLDYAVTKFFAAYPVWSDDDGGWHEGLSYFGGYMSKTVWWMEIARTALGIDSFRKPFFSNFGNYALYTAPPGSPDMGIGDLSFRPPPPSWSFMRYFATRKGNPHWLWWADQWSIEQESGEPVLAFLWSLEPAVTPRAPTALPPSKLFEGTGIAILNTTLLHAADNVQVRFKASPMGRWSHGHDPHNSFTLNAYGVPLLVNNVYRDLYGSPFHKDWVWSTRAQNAVLVNGQGQKPRSADLGGRIVRAKFEDGFDYVLGDATESYEGRLTRAHRHIFFIKPDVILIGDDLAAPQPSTFQYMLHGQGEFQVDEAAQRLTLDRGAAGVVVDYVAAAPLKFRQWTGYSPEPDHRYLASIKSPGIPAQWHVEASSVDPAAVARTLTVIRPYKRGKARNAAPRVTRGEGSLDLEVEGVTVRFSVSGPYMAEIRRDGKSWQVAR